MSIESRVRRTHDTLRLVPTEALERLRAAIDVELARRDVCEHGVEGGVYCESCNLEYKRARREHGDD